MIKVSVYSCTLTNSITLRMLQWLSVITQFSVIPIRCRYRSRPLDIHCSLLGLGVSLSLRVVVDQCEAII